MKNKMRKRWIFIPLCVGLLTLAITGGAIFAHGGSHALAYGQNNFVARVAELLGLETGEVQSAFGQAVQEQQDAGMAIRLDRMVENEAITQEEADAILAWYQLRPDVALVNRILFFRGNIEELQQKLDRAVANEHITQVEADQVMDWVDTRPEVVDTIGRPERRGHYSKFRMGDHRRGDDDRDEDARWGDTRFNRGSFGTRSRSFQAPGESFESPSLDNSVLY